MYQKVISKVRRGINNFLNKPQINAEKISIGKGVKFGKNVVVNAKSFEVGDGCVFHDNVRINSTRFKMGDYGVIYHDCFFPGPGTLMIGHNFWLGNNSIIDAQGDTEIGNNVGIGAHSQLWGHMVYGDVMAGCKYDMVKKLRVGNDVWLVGHNLVSPVTIGDRSMSMLGSLITKDLEEDHTYAGVPAKDLTDKIGTQFKDTSIVERRAYLEGKLKAYEEKYGERIMDRVTIRAEEAEGEDQQAITFYLKERTYDKKGSDLEMKIIQFLLPRVKFIPR